MPEAEQQSVATPEAAPEAAAPQVNEYEAMVKAADAAFASEPEAQADAPKADATPGRGADGKFLPKGDKAAAPEAPAEEEGGSKISAILRAREKANEVREAGKSEAENLIATARATAQEEANKILAAARATAESEASAWKAKFRASPLQAIKEQGIDTRTLVDDVTREGSAEWQAQRRIEAAHEATRAELAELKAWRETQTSKEQQYLQQQQVYARQQVEQRFLGLLPAESAARTLYDESEIVSKAHAAADLYQKETGKVASLEDVRDYLEEQATKRLAGIRTPAASGSSAAQQAAKKASATQPKANGPRALSAASASERRTSPKPRGEWDEADLHDAMMRAADEAMKAT